MQFARQVFVIMGKDLRAELRTKEAINASLSFALVVLLLFSFAFDPDEETIRAISGGLLWIVFAFAGTLLLNRSFARELNNDCLDALISAPIPAAALFLGKALANFVLMLAILNFPILIPALLGAMQLTSDLVAGKPISVDKDAWLKMLIGFDVMYT